MNYKRVRNKADICRDSIKRGTGIQGGGMGGMGGMGMGGMGMGGMGMGGMGMMNPMMVSFLEVQIPNGASNKVAALPKWGRGRGNYTISLR